MCPNHNVSHTVSSLHQHLLVACEHHPLVIHVLHYSTFVHVISHHTALKAVLPPCASGEMWQLV